MDTSKEYILCAAIWFPSEEHTVVHGPRNIDKGIVFSGLGHAQCIGQAAICLYPNWRKDLPSFNKEHDKMRIRFNCERVDGFLTSKNRFVRRIEGGKIALECGQISKLDYDKEKMYSEDLYQ